MPLTQELTQKIAVAPNHEAKILVLELLQKIFTEYNEDSDEINSPFAHSHPTIDLSACALHRLDLVTLKEIAQACIGKLSVQLLPVDSTENLINQEFQNLPYAQQQELALLVLRAKWQKIILHTASLHFKKFGAITSVEGIVFDLDKYPTAYFDLLKNYIAHSTDRSYVMNILIYINYILFQQSTDYRILSKQQFSWLVLFACSEAHIDKMLNIEHASITNICDFCREEIDENTFEVIALAIIELYAFKSLTEKVTFFNNLKQLAQIKNINTEYLFKRIAAQMPNCSFAEIEPLTHLLQNNEIIGAFLKHNTNSLTAQQRSALIDLALTYQGLPNTFLQSLTNEELLKVCNIPNKGLDMWTLPGIMKNKGFTKQEILAVIQERLKDYDPNCYTGFDHTVLELNTAEIKEFMQNNPAWSHVLDSWIQSQPTLSSSESEELLFFRLQNSSFLLQEDSLINYKIDIERLLNFLLENPNINVKGIVGKLSWNYQYRCLIQDFNENPTEIFHIENYNPPEMLKDFIARNYDSLEIDSNMHDVQQIDELEKLKIIKKIIDNCCARFAAIIGATSSYNFELMRGIYTNWFELGEQELDKYALLVGLKFRLLQEAAHENLQVAFAQTEFISIISEVINFAAPHLRSGLIDKIVAIACCREKLNLFAELLKKTSKHCRIPILILIAKITEKITIVKMLSMIGSTYHDKNNLKVLIDSLLTLLQANLTEAQKINIFTKIMTFDLHFEVVKPHIDKLNYNNLFIISDVVDKDVKFGIYGLDIAGELVDIADIALDPRFSALNILLIKLYERGKKFTRNSEEILATIRKTGIFPCSKENQIQGLLMLQGLIALNKVDLLISVEYKAKPWFAVFAAAIQSGLAIAIPEEKFKYVIQTFAAARNPFAVIAYYAKLNSLANQEYAQMLRNFVLLLATPNSTGFYNYRYDLQQQAQLKAVLGNREVQLSVWKKDIYFQYDDVVAIARTLYESTTAAELDVNIYLQKQILHFKHLDPKEFALTHAYLLADDIATKETIKLQAKELFGRYHGYSNKMVLAKFQIWLLKFFDNIHTNSLQQQLKYVLDLERAAQQKPELQIFLADLALVKSFLKKKLKPDDRLANTHNTQQWSIVNTATWEDLLLAGSEVLGSCQSIYGNPQFNRCLIGGYVLAGYNKIIAIKNANQQIVARAILRLMLDTSQNQPVLFLEEVYPKICDLEQKQALAFGAAWCAWQMSCNLVTKMQLSNFNSKHYPAQLKVVAVHGAEYVDALGGPQESEYEISNNWVLFNYAAMRNKVVKPIFNSGQPLGNPALGPRPLNNAYDLAFMYLNYTKGSAAKKTEFNVRLRYSAAQVQRLLAM